MNNDATREEIYTQLVHFFEAYAVLTEQVVLAADSGEVELLGKLMELRQKTIQRVDHFEKKFSKRLTVALDMEPEDAVRQLRLRIQELIDRSAALEVGLSGKMAVLRDQNKSQAKKLATGQRVLRGYTQKVDKRARYVENIK